MDNKNLEERKRIARLIVEYDKLYEKKKGQRTLLVIAFYTIVNLALFIGPTIVSGESISIVQLPVFLLPSIFLAGFAFIVNATIFGNISDKSRSENEHIKRLRQQLEELNKEAGIEKSLEERFRDGMPL